MPVVKKPKKKPKFQCTLHPGTVGNRPASKAHLCCAAYELELARLQKQAEQKTAWDRLVALSTKRTPEMVKGMKGMKGNKPVLAMAVCEADKTRMGDFATLTISQACDAIAGLADLYVRDPDHFCAQFFGRHVPAARRRQQLEAGEGYGEHQCPGCD